MAKSPQSIPNKSFTLVSGEEIHMSYGLFSDIMRLLGNSETAVDLLLSDPSLQGFVVRRIFTVAQKPVENIDELINPYEIDMSPLELDDLLAWVADHVMHFIVSTAEKTRPVVGKYQDRAASLSQSRIGSES